MGTLYINNPNKTFPSFIMILCKIFVFNIVHLALLLLLIGYKNIDYIKRLAITQINVMNPNTEYTNKNILFRHIPKTTSVCNNFRYPILLALLIMLIK